MILIIGAFDKVDIKLLSYENLFHHMDYRILQKTLKLKSAKKLRKKFLKKVQTFIEDSMNLSKSLEKNLEGHTSSAQLH